MIIEEVKQPRITEVPDANPATGDGNVLTENKKTDKPRKKVNLIRLREKDLQDQENGIPALNRHFKENHSKIMSIPSNVQKISKNHKKRHKKVFFLGSFVHILREN